MSHMFNKPYAAQSQSENGRVFIALVLSLVVVFVAGITLLVRSDYKRTVNESEDQLAYIAELLEQSVEATLAVANLQMWSMIDQIALTELGTTEEIESRYGDLLRKTVEEIDQINSVVLIATDGNVVWASVDNLSGRYLGDRQYFREALRLGEGEYAVGVPLIARGSGQRVTPIAWPVASPYGRVLGVIVSSLGEEYFSDLLSLTEFPPDLHVDIQASNGAAAFHSNDAPREIGSTIISATREIASLGLTIDVSRSKHSVMAAFYVRTAGFIAVAIILFSTAIGMAIRLKAKSVQLATGLHRSKEDNYRIVAAQREFNTIFDNVGDGIVIFSEDGTLNRTNKMAREILGTEGSEAAVARLRTLLPEFSDINSDFEVHRIKTDETQPDQAVQCRVMKLTTGDQEIAYCVLTDVTAEERLAAARTNFITSINHELRTPLTSLAGALELMENRYAESLPAPAARLLAMGSRNADRLLLLVNDILTLQAIDQGKFHVDAEPVPVETALEEAISTNSGYGVATGVKLKCTASVTGDVFVDPDRLQQIFSNLISNAVKYSRPEGIVEIGAQEAGDEVTFYVRDTGPGIPKAARHRLYERFTTPLHGRGVQMSGTGLGLAITKQLVERQDGQITFETRTEEDGQKDTGTVFYVTFKRPAAPAMEKTA